jgi:hypothetical protein
MVSPMLVGAAETWSLALAALGALIVVAAALDLFLTVFNYDGFNFVAVRFQHLLWKLLRTASRVLPRRARHSALSLGSAAMLPATVALWLGLEITGFALMFERGVRTGGFKTSGVGSSIGDAFYVSGGAISSLTFGDVVPRGTWERAAVDLETILGLATFTLALGYVVTAFGALGALENLHGRVRRHAEDAGRPSSIIARHFRGGQPSDLPSFLQALGDDLESYDQGLRRYPVVYYFHTRRLRRSIPFVFESLGQLLALLRWGLPRSEPMTQDPFLHALVDAYDTTLERLRRSFVGPRPLDVPEPLSREEFAVSSKSTHAGGARGIAAFRQLERRALAAAGWSPDDDDETRYERYREWFPFAYRRHVVLDRVADALGYDRPSEKARAAQG